MAAIKMFLPAFIVLALAIAGVLLFMANDRKQVTAAVSAAGPAAASTAETGEIAWRQSLPEAQAEAKRRKTLIVVDAYADWCHWCKKLDEDTFSNAEVRHRMQDFVPLRINTDHHPELAQRYAISGLPTTLVLDATGEVKLNQSGYLPPREYLQLLNRVAPAHTD